MPKGYAEGPAAEEAERRREELERGVADDAETLRTAVFGSTRGGFEFTDLRPPDVVPPSECRSFREFPPLDQARGFR